MLLYHVVDKEFEFIQIVYFLFTRLRIIQQFTQKIELCGLIRIAFFHLGIQIFPQRIRFFLLMDLFIKIGKRLQRHLMISRIIETFCFLEHLIEADGCLFDSLIGNQLIDIPGFCPINILVIFQFLRGHLIKRTIFVETVRIGMVIDTSKGFQRLKLVFLIVRRESFIIQLQRFSGIILGCGHGNDLFDKLSHMRGIHR